MLYISLRKNNALYVYREKLVIEKRNLLNEMYELRDELNSKQNSMVNVR